MFCKFTETEVIYPPHHAETHYNVHLNPQWLKENGFEDKTEAEIQAFIDTLPQPIEKYDQAMEEYLKATRIARGYTQREPSDYITSSNARWKQDASDWITFRDSVMEYGLQVQNEFTATGNAPTLAEFKANFPVVHWSLE